MSRRRINSTRGQVRAARKAAGETYVMPADMAKALGDHVITVMTEIESKDPVLRLGILADGFEWWKAYVAKNTPFFERNLVPVYSSAYNSKMNMLLRLRAAELKEQKGAEKQQ